MDQAESNPWIWLAGGVVLGSVLTYFISTGLQTKGKTLESQESEEEDDSSLSSGSEDDSSEEDCKMVLAINLELKMKPGKIAAQCGHATLGAYRRAERSARPELKRWMYRGQTKITIRVPDVKTLVQLEKKCEAAGLTTYLVEDAGRTQIPSGSRTVLAVFGPVSKVDALTGKAAGFALY